MEFAENIMPSARKEAMDVAPGGEGHFSPICTGVVHYFHPVMNKRNSSCQRQQRPESRCGRPKKGPKRRVEKKERPFPGKKGFGTRTRGRRAWGSGLGAGDRTMSLGSTV